MSKPATHSITAPPSTRAGSRSSGFAITCSPRIAIQAGNGRQHQRRAQPEMGQHREPLGVAVAQQKHQHRQRQVQAAADWAETRACGDERDRAIAAKGGTLPTLQNAGGKVPRRACADSRASIRRSASRLKAIAALRAATMHSTMPTSSCQRRPPAADRRTAATPSAAASRRKRHEQRVAEADHFQQVAERRKHFVLD